MWNAGHVARDIGCEMLDMGHGVWSVGYGMWDVGHNVELGTKDVRCRTWGVGHET